MAEMRTEQKLVMKQKMEVIDFIKKPFSGGRSIYYQYKQAYKSRVAKDLTVAYILSNRFIAKEEPLASIRAIEEDDQNQQDVNPTELSEYADSILDDEDLDNREKVIQIMAVLDDE